MTVKTYMNYDGCEYYCGEWVDKWVDDYCEDSGDKCENGWKEMW